MVNKNECYVPHNTNTNDDAHYNRLMSKFDLRRLCKSINATPLPRLTAPTAEEMGYCDDIRLDEIGDTSIIVFNQGTK